MRPIFDAALARGVRIVCNTWGLPWLEPVETRAAGPFYDQTIMLFVHGASGAASSATATAAATDAGSGRGCSSGTETPFVNGKRVLDLCSGGGVQGLTAAALGAVRVRLVEMNPRAARFARANVALNGLSGAIEVIEGDATDVAIGGGEVYDVVLINPPYIPNDGAPGGSLTAFGDGGTFGEQITSKVVQNLPRLLRADGGRFALVANLVNPALLPAKLRGWLDTSSTPPNAGENWRWSVLYGRPWSLRDYASLILSLDVESKAVAGYAEGLANVGIQEVANGFIVGVVSTSPSALPPPRPPQPPPPPPPQPSDCDTAATEEARQLHDELWIAVTRGDEAGYEARWQVAEALRSVAFG